jgi:hypothetical protein
VELPDSFLETIKGMRGSPLVESLGKLCKRERLTKKVSLRNIDSVFPNNGAKMLSHNLYFDQRKG